MEREPDGEVGMTGLEEGKETRSALASFPSCALTDLEVNCGDYFSKPSVFKTHGLSDFCTTYSVKNT